MLTIPSPNTDRSLLTILELRAAVGLGVADGSQDVALAALGLRTSAGITKACRVASAGATPPTLRLETVTETFRSDRHHGGNSRVDHPLILARRPVGTINSVIENGTTLDAADYEVEEGSGLLWRLSGDCRSCWTWGKVIVDYTAGWEAVPDDLKQAAAVLARSYWFEALRTPGLRSEDTPGVYSATYHDKDINNPNIPSEVMQALAPYMNHAVA